MVSRLMVNYMVKVVNSTSMAHSMKVTSSMEPKRVKASTPSWMVLTTRATSKQKRCKGKVSSFGATDRNMKVIGSIIKSTGKE